MISEDNQSQKPQTVLIAEYALWVWTAWACLFGIYQSWRGIPEIQSMMHDQLQDAFAMSSQTMMLIIVPTYLLLGAISAWIVWKIGAGKNWARSSLMWSFALQMGWAIIPPYHSIKEYVTDIPDIGLQAYAVYLLYTPPGRGWFKHRL